MFVYEAIMQEDMILPSIAAMLESRVPSVAEPLRALMAEVGPKWRDDTSGNIDLMVTELS